MCEFHISEGTRWVIENTVLRAGAREESPEIGVSEGMGLREVNSLQE